MKEITKYNPVSIIGYILAAIVILFLLKIVFSLLAWTLSGLIPLLIAVALVLIIIRLWQGKTIL